MHCIRCTSPRPAHILHIENIWVLSLDTRPYGPLSFLCKSFLIFREKYLNYCSNNQQTLQFFPRWGNFVSSRTEIPIISVEEIFIHANKQS